MEITTRLKIGDKVWQMKDNKPTEMEIGTISITVAKDGSIGIQYLAVSSTRFGGTLTEGKDPFFSTKEELIKSL